MELWIKRRLDTDKIGRVRNEMNKVRKNIN